MSTSLFYTKLVELSANRISNAVASSEAENNRDKIFKDILNNGAFNIQNEIEFDHDRFNANCFVIWKEYVWNCVFFGRGGIEGLDNNTSLIVTRLNTSIHNINDFNPANYYGYNPPNTEEMSDDRLRQLLKKTDMGLQFFCSIMARIKTLSDTDIDIFCSKANMCKESIYDNLEFCKNWTFLQKMYLLSKYDFSKTLLLKKPMLKNCEYLLFARSQNEELYLLQEYFSKIEPVEKQYFVNYFNFDRYKDNSDICYFLFTSPDLLSDSILIHSRFSDKGQAQIDIENWITAFNINKLKFTEEAINIVVFKKPHLLPYLSLTEKNKMNWETPLLNFLHICEEKYLPTIIVKLKECNNKNSTYDSIALQRCSDIQILSDVFEIINRSDVFYEFVLPKIKTLHHLILFFKQPNFKILSDNKTAILQQIPTAVDQFDQTLIRIFDGAKKIKRHPY